VDNQQQFLEAYDKYAPAISRYCYYRVFDMEKAKDVVQETFTRTWKYMADGKKVENIRALLYRIATNIIIEESKKKKISSLDKIMEEGFAPFTDTRQKTQDHFTAEEIIVIIKTLNEKHRDVVLMKYVEELTTEEIAFALDETENNVYVMISRGLKLVRKIMKNRHI
jgi:RNA polymerase sigma-70 factor (ECF subfamily)